MRLPPGSGYDHGHRPLFCARFEPRATASQALSIKNPYILWVCRRFLPLPPWKGPSLRSAACCSILFLSLACSNHPPQTWRYWAADAASSKYAPHAQIHAGNFADLQVAWRYQPPDPGHGTNRGTPIEVDGVLYYGSPANILCAVDAHSGAQLWAFDPEVWKKPEGFLGNLRGIAYWRDGEHQRIFFGNGNGTPLLHRHQNGQARSPIRPGRLCRSGPGPQAAGK